MGFYPVSDTYSALSFVTFGEFSSLSLSFLFKSGVMVLITSWGLRKSEKFRKVLSTVPDTVRTQEILQPKRKEAEGRRGHRCGEEAGKVPIINNLESHDKSKHFSESKSKSMKCFTQRRLESRSQDFSFVLKLSETTPLSAGEHRVRLYPPPWVSVPEHSVIIRDQDFQESATRPSASRSVTPSIIENQERQPP